MTRLRALLRRLRPAWHAAGPLLWLVPLAAQALRAWLAPEHVADWLRLLAFCG